MDIRVFFAAVFCCTGSAVLGAVTCPDGFTAHGDTCYLFSHETATWAGAYLSCQLLGGQLVEIENAAENQYLKNVVGGLGGAGWYIGATDKAVEGEFVWMKSKTPLARSFTDWFPGEPGNAGHDESCACLYQKGSYLWVDISCEAKINYICENSSGVITDVAKQNRNIMQSTLSAYHKEREIKYFGKSE